VDGAMRNVSNFLFHRVNPERDLLWDPMDVKLFDKCIKYISKNFHVVLLEDMVLNKHELKGSKNYATIVFDDGYKDNFQYALPILEKYKVKASFYIVTDCIDKNIPTWTHLVDHAFLNTNHDKIDMSFNFLPEELRVSRLKDKTLRVNYVRKLKPALKKIRHSERMLVMDRILGAFNDIQFPSLMMNWDEIKQLRSAGHYIGSHTVTHCMLGTMNNVEAIQMELTSSGEKIMQNLGYFPLTISYPVGSYNATTIEQSKLAGYKIGLAVKQEVYDPIQDIDFEIPRIELYNESWLKTRLRIENVVGRVSKLLKGI
jgi:peptidoglycan/xylan/chitin deacetylase (PgdA/CDA1 family)